MRGLNMKDRIVSTALDLFASHGFDSISTTEIAQRVGISQPNIHYYFKTKDDLWKAAVEELNLRIRHSSAATVSASLIQSLDPLSALKVISSTLHQVSREVPELGKLIFLEGQAGGKRLDWLMQRTIQPTYDIFTDLIEKCIQQKRIKPYHPHQILMMLHGAAVAYYNLRPLVKSAFNVDPSDPATSNRFVDMYLDIFFTGLECQQTD